MFVQQSIQRPHGVNVFGSCLVRAEPDYASVRFSVTSVAADPQDALSSARDGADKVHRTLAGAGVADADVRSSQVSLEYAYEGYGENRKPIGYRAAMRFQVFARDLANLDSLLVDLVDAGAREIHSVSYKTTRMRELRRTAREGAVASARAKAEVYATAAGRKLGAAIHIEDVNPDQLASRSHAPDVDLDSHDEGEGGARKGSIVISGAVMMCFALID